MVISISGQATIVHCTIWVKADTFLAKIAVK